jgi:hypothetical protein
MPRSYPAASPATTGPGPCDRPDLVPVLGAGDDAGCGVDDRGLVTGGEAAQVVGGSQIKVPCVGQDAFGLLDGGARLQRLLDAVGDLLGGKVGGLDDDGGRDVGQGLAEQPGR